MPSKIKSKLLIITVLSITLAVLFIIAPNTAALYSVIFMGVCEFLAILAWNSARTIRELQYKVSSFISICVFVFVALMASFINIGLGNMHIAVVGACTIVVVRCLSLLFEETK